MARVSKRKPSELQEDEFFTFHPKHTEKIKLSFQCSYGQIGVWIYAAADEHDETGENGVMLNLTLEMLDYLYEEQLCQEAVEITDE